MADNKEKLFTDFPPVSTEQWMERVTADLKGADFEKRLVWKTNEGFKVQPFYRQEDIKNLRTTDSLPGEFPYVRGTKKDNDWFVRQEIKVTDVKEANKKTLDILNKGINSLGFNIPGDKISTENIKKLLEGICLDCVELNFRSCQKEVVKLTKVLIEYFKSTGINPESIQGSVNYDPFSRILKAGKDAGEIKKEAAELIQLSAEFKNFRVIGVSAYLFNNAGAYITQELGFGLAYGNEYLSLLTDAGVSVDDAAGNIKFNFGVGSNYFMEIAKFRAGRMLWAKIVDAYKPGSKEAAKMKVHAFTSEWNQTIYDAHVNLLRSQTEAMSASIAGVDSLTVVPFDYAFKTPDEFSERIARNQQLLLKEESHFDKIVDPGAGSYYIETLTDSIAEQAWNIFLEVENKGGFYAALKEGYVQNEIKKSAVARFEALAKRKEILLGTNQFPNFNEFAKDKIKKEPKSGCCEGNSCGTLQPLDFSRGAVEFEALRLATENSGKRPKVFMLTIGNLAMRLARAQFSSNFFACAGYEIIDNLGFQTVEEGVKAARKANADIIVLCSSDDEYAELAPAAYETISGKELLVVAGAPECMEDLKAKGIKSFINVKSNVLETLKGFNKQLNIF
jgi:methylmalonyl-CoA mutase